MFRESLEFWIHLTVVVIDTLRRLSPEQPKVEDKADDIRGYVIE